VEGSDKDRTERQREKWERGGKTKRMADRDIYIDNTGTETE